MVFPSEADWASWWMRDRFNSRSQGLVVSYHAGSLFMDKGSHVFGTTCCNIGLGDGQVGGIVIGFCLGLGAFHRDLGEIRICFPEGG